MAEQRSFENKVVSQHSQNSTDAVIVGDALALYKVNNGTYFCIIGSIDENPYILESALDALHQAISTLVRGITDRRTLLENLDYVVLVIDEVIDDGILLEVDYQAIVNRVATDTEVPLSDQTFAQAFQSARSTLDSLLK